MSLIYLVLGMLNNESSSGYDLNKNFQMSVNHFWTTDQSQIYRALHKLRDKGWVQLEHIIQHDNPDKKVYHITQEGRQAFMEWARRPFTLDDEPVREGWVGQVFFGQDLTNTELMELLKVYQKREEEAVAALNALCKAIPQEYSETRLAQMQLLSLDFGLHIRQAYADWLKKAIEQISKMDET